MTLSSSPKLKVAWISDFPIEWLHDLPESLTHLPRRHARSWQQVLLQEFENKPSLELHIMVLRRKVGRDITFQRKGVTFHILNVPTAVREQSLFWVDTIRLKRALAKIKPDLVHAWGTERGAHLVAKRLGYPCLVTIQGLLTWYGELIPLNIYEKFAALLERWHLPSASLVTTESTLAVKFLRERFSELKVWQAEHAPNRIFHGVRRSPQTKPFRFLFIGHLGYRKGADLLFSALAQIGKEIPFELVVLGEVEARFLPMIQSLAANKASSRVEIRRNLNASQIAEELSVATMLLFPTRADTSPNAVKEAVVAGVPVVASAVGGILDYVITGKNGFTFPSEQVAAFVSKILEACHHPLFSRGMVDEQTLHQMRTHLAPERMSDRFLMAYDVVAGRLPFPSEDSLMLFKPQGPTSHTISDQR